MKNPPPPREPMNVACFPLLPEPWLTDELPTCVPLTLSSLVSVAILPMADITFVYGLTCPLEVLSAPATLPLNLTLIELAGYGMVRLKPGELLLPCSYSTALAVELPQYAPIETNISSVLDRFMLPVLKLSSTPSNSSQCLPAEVLYSGREAAVACVAWLPLPDLSLIRATACPSAVIGTVPAVS